MVFVSYDGIDETEDTVFPDMLTETKKIEKYIQKKFSGHIWHGTGSGVEKKLAANIKKWQDAGYAVTYKVFTDVGHGGVAAQRTEHFLKEVIRAHGKR